MTTQQQFLDVIDRDEAERRFHAAVDLAPLGEELARLEEALGRVLARDVVVQIDVPSFDRSNFDGFALCAADTFGAREEDPRRLTLLPEVIATAVVPTSEITPGTAVSIATGGMLPRGADAIMMVEHTDVDGEGLLLRRAVTPGAGITFAGTDISAGETVLRCGEVLSSRETGVLAAVGIDVVHVWRRPRVMILSTGDEIIQPGQPMRPGLVYDSNARILADAVRELGGEPIAGGVVRDDIELLCSSLQEALHSADIVLLSGGTSKGAGDLCYQVVSQLSDPGIVVHGVALKPGKPICLAASNRKPVVILPGFPTSAIFTFYEFVAPVIRSLGGRPAQQRTSVRAHMAVKVNSEIGRTEYLLVGLVERQADNTTEPVTLSAYPMGKGSGSVTTFSRADGFVTIGRYEEILDAGAIVDVQLIGRDLRVADLVVIGSHCVGLDLLLGKLQEQGYHTKFLAVGSTAGLEAAQRGECDLAGVHLLDPETGQYNRPFLTPELELIQLYGRWQGIVYRPGDERLEGKSSSEAIAVLKDDPASVMINRNQGSGTRILIDRLLDGAQPPGYAVQPRNHNAVAAAIVQGRADWGVAIQSVASRAQLGFLPLTQERYDLAVSKSRAARPAIEALRHLLVDDGVREQLRALGLEI